MAAFKALLFEKLVMFSGSIFTCVFCILLFYTTRLYCFFFFSSYLSNVVPFMFCNFIESTSLIDPYFKIN